MKTIKGIPVWAATLILLLLANMGWMSWNLYQHANLCAATKQFKVLVLHTNDASGVGIAEAKTGNLLWAEWSFTNNSHTISYFFHGTNIFNLDLFKERPLTYSVGFHGPGKSSVWWWDLGRGTFIERNFFSTNGDFIKYEVWYNQAWHTAITRNGKDGIIINGQWCQLTLPTNAMWTIDTNLTRQP